MSTQNLMTPNEIAQYLRVSGTTVNRLAIKYGLDWIVLHKRQRVMTERNALTLIKRYEKERQDA